MNRPWEKRAEELFAREDMWADYVAFREWFSARERALVNPGDILEILDKQPTIDPINLYCIFCDLFDSMPDMPEYVEVT
jgi:hypothetical protein